MELYHFVKTDSNARTYVTTNTILGQQSWIKSLDDFCQKYIESLSTMSVAITTLEAYAESVLQLIQMLYVTVYVGFKPGKSR